MKLAVDQDYPATPDRLWSVFSDPAYPPAKYLALGAKHVEVTRFSASDATIEVELSRRIAVDLEKLPGFARKLIGAEQTMTHHSRWRRIGPTEVRGELTITAVGRPVRIVGTASLVPSGEGASRLSFAFDITSAVPLLGGKIARLFAEQVEAALKADHGFTLGYLGGRA